MNTPRMLRTCLTILLAFHLARATTNGAEFEYPPTISQDEVREWVDRAPAAHPRLLATAEDLAALRREADKDPLRRALAEAIIAQADLIQDAAPVTRTLQGRRLLGQSRRCVSRVIKLATAYHLTGEPRYVQRCQEEMLAAAAFSDWNPSHFLDVGEMTFALAIGYDWLFDQLDADSREKIREAIIQKGVVLPFETRHKGWVRATNNWGQVCHGGLTAGALAVMEHEPDLAARTVHNALHNVTRAMAAYAPKGSYPEGPGYWSYGTSYNVVLIGVLESALGTNFGLTQAPGFSKTGQYVPLVCGPSGLFFNYADGGASRGPQPALFWFASRLDRPDWLLGERELLMDRLSDPRVKRVLSDGSRLLPLTLLWMDGAPDDPEIRMPLHWTSQGETPISVHRSSWTDPDAVFIGLKGGSPSANHGQMDIGSFVLDADGVRWAMDLGAEGYHGIESRGMNLWSRAQDSDRWTIFRQRNHGHNTLVIDDQLQRAAGMAPITRFSDNSAFAFSIVDLAPVYKGQVQAAQRGVALVDSGEVLIQDELSGLQPGARVRWGMITPAASGSVGDSDIQLRQGDQRLALSIVSPPDAVWKTIDTARRRNDWDSPNRGTVMIAFEATAPSSGQLTLSVLATPGSCRNSTGNTRDIRPLAQWGE